MVKVFVFEITQSCQHRIGCSLPKSAKRTLSDLIAQSFQKINIFERAFALRDAFKRFKHSRCSYAAEGAFAAGFAAGEVQKIPGGFHHTAVFADNDHTAGTHDGTQTA